MPLTIECPSCKWKGRAPDAALGRKVRCPSCQGEFTAKAPPPAPSAPAEDDLEVVEDIADELEKAVKDRADDEDRPRKRRRDRDEDDEEEDDDRPRKKKRRYDDEDDEEEDDRP